MKLLLPIDGSECANKTLEWVSSIFDNQTTEYFLLHVVPIIPDLATVEYDIAEATNILQKARTFLQEKGCKTVHVDYLLGEPADQICRYVDTMALDQVVIGSHGRSGLAKILMGSVGETVLEHCHKPVIIYRNIERKPTKPLLSNTVL